MPTTGKHPYRWPCSVPGCRCTHGADHPMKAGDWALCRKHWPLVPRKMKAVVRRAEKRCDEAWRELVKSGDTSTHNPLAEAHHKAFRHRRWLYDRLLKFACERALGIG